MEETSQVLEFLKLVVMTTVSQLAWLLGLLFFFGFILYLLARFTRNTYMKSAGRRLDVIATGWIGTPIHELGHMFFCLIFGHRVDEFRLYKLNNGDGTLGYVNHSYDPANIYHRIGNFFIGVGPIIFGAMVLYALLYFLVPNRQVLLEGIHSHSQFIIAGIRGEYSKAPGAFLDTIRFTTANLFTSASLSDYRFWIFLYLAMCISSHMELSPPDIKGAWKGLISLVLFFLLLNLIILGFEATGMNSEMGSWWHYLKIETYETGINKWVGMFAVLFVFATIISGINFVFSYLTLSIYNLIRGKGFINPL
jgi:hypothetical protein